jgi:segregation and condensation protein B
MEFNTLKKIIEAAILASNTPMSATRLAELFSEDDSIPNGEIGRALESLHGECEGRGVELVEVASGFRYQVRQDVHAWVARMWTERPSRYSRALLETLALIAYRQPITRGEIESVRGVSVSSSIIKTLEEREWIRVVGHRDVPGRPGLFGTTREFLDYFNLKSLDELPSLAEIRDMEDFDPQLNLDGEAPTARASMPSEETALDEVADTGADSSPSPPKDAVTEASPQATVATGDADPNEANDIPTFTPTQATAEEAPAAADVDTDAADPDTEENRA